MPSTSELERTNRFVAMTANKYSGCVTTLLLVIDSSFLLFIAQGRSEAGDLFAFEFTVITNLQFDAFVSPCAGLKSSITPAPFNPQSK